MMTCGASVIWVVLVLLGSAADPVLGYRILGINTSPSRSHVIVQDALMKELARRGHHVTMVSPYKESEQVPNYRKITMPHVIGTWGKDFTASMLSNNNVRFGMIKSIPMLLQLSASSINETVRSAEVQDLLREPEGYDVLITGLMTDAVLGLATDLGCPTIVICPNAPMAVVNSMVGNPTPLSLIPNMMLGLSSPMSFWQRVLNVFGWVGEETMTLAWKYYQRAAYNDLFPADRYPSYESVRRNVSLVFLNHHFSKGVPRPYVPAMIEVGGLQIKDKPSPLPTDVRQFIEEAEHGVILFSLGTNLLSSSMPPEKLDAILGTFRALKQRVIWKWNSQDMPRKPDNVMLREWLPQDDILAHPNVRLFIMHGGLGGIAEALFHAVPLVGIPMFGDQPGNLEKVEQEGWVRVVQYAELTEQTLSAAVREVLENGQYRENVRRLSQLFRDRPQSAMDTAVYWTEYVIRHRGAPHLRYPGVDMNFWQRASLDVIAFLAVTGYALCKLISLVWRICCRGRGKSKLKKH
ncbi:UDP-glycosyltransferase UGT5-like [Anopheles bellator]|uniref:UDP-glycosyltransferase UGT5-like n=1 Tax=Anopheles bellator TaxID=139047 RepID=UPI002647D2FA|nr:UDP-glycosyltransferase UGT5-like [Anopheles bellator]